MPRQKKRSKNYPLVATLVEEIIKEQAETNLATKADLKYLPTKTEFYNSMDKIMGELSAMREENAVTAGMKHQVNNHEDRLETIEDKLGIRATAD